MKYIIVAVAILLAFLGGTYATHTRTTTDAQKENPQSKGRPTTENTKSKEESIIPTDTTKGAALDLSGQNLTKAPEYIFTQVTLVVLDLSDNKLSGALQAEIRHLQNLKALDLSHNNFTGVPAEIGQLKNLETLNLSNNQLTGLPYELGNLSRLKLLDLSGNAYSEADLSKIRENLPSSTIIKTK